MLRENEILFFLIKINVKILWVNKFGLTLIPRKEQRKKSILCLQNMSSLRVVSLLP